MTTLFANFLQVPLRLRGQYFGFLSSMWALGSVVGPILGGGFAQNVTWRWIFYINLPFCAIAFVLVPIYLNLNQKIESVNEVRIRSTITGDES
jgi:MFS family permease